MTKLEYNAFDGVRSQKGGTKERQAKALPFQIISSGVAGSLKGTLGIPTQTSTPKWRKIPRLCIYAASLFAVQMTA